LFTAGHIQIPLTGLCRRQLHCAQDVERSFVPLTLFGRIANCFEISVANF
jgi:hypothetical protein